MIFHFNPALGLHFITDFYFHTYRPNFNYVTWSVYMYKNKDLA
jgi:hypothetical protein